MEERFFERVYSIVRQIPRGRVATYGEIAALAGVPRGARAVGWALRALSVERAVQIPWHRVVGAGGRLAVQLRVRQASRLRAEGVSAGRAGVDLARFGVRLATYKGTTSNCSWWSRGSLLTDTSRPTSAARLARTAASSSSRARATSGLTRSRRG
jgi:methylated-DNA-protein-cysteine methyltransferase related protein